MNRASPWWVFPGLLCLLCAAFTAAAAEAYPSRPIRIVVSSAAGSGPDVVARLCGPRLAELLGQSVVIDNRSGAGGNIGAEIAAQAAADGHTLLMATANHAIAMSLYARLNYDLLRDFRAVGQLAATPYLLVVHPGSVLRSTAELVAAGKQKPGALGYGSGGSGSPPHLAAEVFARMAGIRLHHVPYKGVTPALTDLAAGRLDLVISALPAALPLARSGKLRALGVSTAQRSALAPEMPLIAETVPGYDVSGWYGLLAPAATPAVRVERLHLAAVNALQSEELRQRLQAVGAEPQATSPGRFAQLLKAEVARWGQAVRESGARPE